MKNILIIICLLAQFFAQGQKYFQLKFNLNYTTQAFRNDRFNGGILTRENYAAGNSYYYSAVGTSYYAPLPLVLLLFAADRLRFTRLSSTGTVLNNLAYQFSDANNKAFNSRGKSIAEISNGQGTGGYIEVGAVTSNPK